MCVAKKAQGCAATPRPYRYKAAPQPVHQRSDTMGADKQQSPESIRRELRGYRPLASEPRKPPVSTYSARVEPNVTRSLDEYYADEAGKKKPRVQLKAPPKQAGACKANGVANNEAPAAETEQWPGLEGWQKIEKVNSPN